MTLVNNSLSAQLENSNILQQNGIRIANVFLDAVTTNKETASVDLVNLDNTVTTVNIPSNVYLGAELNRLRQSLLNLSGLANNQANTLVDIDDPSSFRQIIATNYKRTFDSLNFSELSVNNNVDVSVNGAVKNFFNPLTNLIVDLPIRVIDTDTVRITKFKLNTLSDFSNFTNGETYSSALVKLNNLSHERTDEIVNPEHRINRYNGNFNVTSVVDNDDNTFTVVLNTINYNDSLNVVDNSREIQISDKLITEDGNSRFNVTSVNNLTNTITLTFEAGYTAITTGENKLQFLYTNETETRKIKIPVTFNERSIVFLSPNNNYTKVESNYSQAILIDSSALTVVDNNTLFNFDEFFTARVADIGNKIESLVRENNIPALQGVKPERPVLTSNNFKVVQINRHITETPNIQKITAIQAQKIKTQSDIDNTNTEINKLNLRVSRGNFKSSAEKRLVQNNLNTQIDNKRRLSSLFQTTVSDINNVLSETRIDNISPKYRVRGFWNVQSDISSTTTGLQRVIKYDVRYRYVPSSSDVTEAQLISYNDINGNSITGTFTPWNVYDSPVLRKVIDSNGNLVWEDNIIEDGNQQNINQIDIPINFGESVLIQVRAISEAGYPISPVVSEWSEISRVNFSNSLLIENDLLTLRQRNSEDQVLVAVQKEFSNEGITEHIQTSIREQDKYFAHTAQTIASGYLSDEQRIISMFDYITNLNNRISQLDEIVNRRLANVSVELLDPNNNSTYTVNNFTKLNIFAGYYTDDVDVSDSSNFGKIITKTIFLKLSNKNAQTVELLSTSPGALNSVTDNLNYNNIPISVTNMIEGSEQQLNGQVVYIRNSDITDSNNKYFIEDAETSETVVSSQDINTIALNANKNIVSYAGSSPQLVALRNNPSLSGYVVMTTTHPTYQQFLQTGTDEARTDLNAEFNRLSTFNSIYKRDNVQNAYSESRSTAFVDNDRFLVGQNSVGSRLFMELSDTGNIQINGIDTGSVRTLFPGDENALVIPIQFQYRMTDAVGNINGVSSLTGNSNFTYTKTIGLDLIVRNELFKFDLTVSAKFRPTAVSNNNIVSSVSQQIDTISSNVPSIS